MLTILIYVSAFLEIIAIILLFILTYPTPAVVKNTRKVELEISSYVGSQVEKKTCILPWNAVMASFGYGSIKTFILYSERNAVMNTF